MYIVILEDDIRRIEAMRQVLAVVAPGHDVRIFDSAPEMIRWLEGHLDRVALISLDHDLIPELGVDGSTRDLGCGRDVADFLAGRPPACPVILHTANYLAAPIMEETMVRSGWDVKRVVPFVDLDWIDSAWGMAIELKLKPGRGKAPENTRDTRTSR
jgi:hypothetical protein